MKVIILHINILYRIIIEDHEKLNMKRLCVNFNTCTETNNACIVILKNITKNNIFFCLNY